MTRAAEETELAGWADLCAYLTRTKRELADRTGERFRVTEAGVATWFSALTSPHGQPWLALAVPICPVRRLRFRPCLAVNLTLPVGGLALGGEQALLRQTLPLGGLRAEQLEEVWGALRQVAAILLEATQAGEKEYAYLFR